TQKQHRVIAIIAWHKKRNRPLEWKWSMAGETYKARLDPADCTDNYFGNFDLLSSRKKRPIRATCSTASCRLEPSSRAASRTARSAHWGRSRLGAGGGTAGPAVERSGISVYAGNRRQGESHVQDPQEFGMAAAFAACRGLHPLICAPLGLR